MSLINFLLSGYCPESEIFIEQYVPKFRFVNFEKQKNTKIYFQFDYILLFFTKYEYNKNNKPIYDIAKNKLPVIINNIIIKKNVSNVWLYLKYSHYVKFNELSKNIVQTSKKFDLSNSNVSNSNVLLQDVINFISESFQYEDSECHPWLQINQRLAGFHFYEYNTILHIYPHFTDL